MAIKTITINIVDPTMSDDTEIFFLIKRECGSYELWDYPREFRNLSTDEIESLTGIKGIEPTDDNTITPTKVHAVS